MEITAIPIMAAVAQQGIQNQGIVPIQSVATAAIGLLSLVFSFLPTASASFVPNCLNERCPDLKKDQLHCWEQSAISSLDNALWGSSSFNLLQEFLRFRTEDPRDKSLYFLPNTYNFHAAADKQWGSYVLEPIAAATDIKIRTVFSFFEICNEIDQASKVGKLNSVFIDTSGNSQAISLSRNHQIDQNLDFQSCFKSLQPSGTIVLMGGRGADSYDRLAQKIATASDKVVLVITGSHYRLEKIAVEEALAPSSSRAKGIDTTQAFKKFYPGCESSKSISTNANCICPPCPDLNEGKVHSKELEAGKLVYRQSHWGSGTFKEHQEYLRLNRDDLRPKVLYLSAKEDYNGALDPKADLLSPISKQFDLKFKKVKSFEEICREVKDASKVGKLANVVINAHGEPNSMGLSGINEIVRKHEFGSCFSDLTPSGKIILNSCYAGAPQLGDTHDNIAQTIADKAKRTVIAAKSYTVSNSRGFSFTKIISLDPFMVSHTSNFHPSKDLVGLSVYRIFQPQYSDCSDIEPNKLHDREWLAIDAINDDLKNKGFEPFTPTWEKSREYLRLCKDDLRDKVIFLSAAHDPKDRTNPKFNPDFLGSLNDKTDLQYKVVNSYDGMCRTIDAASKTGNLALVLIQAYGLLSSDKTKLEGFHLWEETDPFDPTKIAKEEKITLRSKDLQACFSGLNPSGKVILLSNSLGAPERGGFAQKFANVIDRTVVALTGNTHPEKRKITSYNPYVIYAPSGYFSTQNLYKEFYPQ